jgi:hypothetical protein
MEKQLEPWVRNPNIIERFTVPLARVPYPGEPFNEYPESIQYAAYLPDLTVGEFFNNLRIVFNLGYFFDMKGNRVDLLYLRDVIQGTCLLDWTEKVVPEWGKDIQDAKEYSLSSEVETGDELTKAMDPQLSGYGTGKDKITTKFGTVATQEKGGRVMPHVEQKGNSVLFSQQNAFLPRLLFYHGNIRTALNHLYPKADNVSLDGNFSLQWTGAKGLYETYWKDWIAFLERTAAIELPVMLDIVDLANLDFRQKVYIRGNQYLIERVQVSLPLTRPSRVTLRRC